MPRHAALWCSLRVVPSGGEGEDAREDQLHTRRVKRDDGARARTSDGDITRLKGPLSCRGGRVESFNGLFIIKFIMRWKRRRQGEHEAACGDYSVTNWKCGGNFPLLTSTGTVKGGSIPQDLWPSKGPYWLLLAS